MGGISHSSHIVVQQSNYRRKRDRTNHRSLGVNHACLFCDPIRYQENHTPQADPIDDVRRDPEPDKAHGPKRMEEN
jgi:hypothetical protein